MDSSQLRELYHIVLKKQLRAMRKNRQVLTEDTEIKDSRGRVIPNARKVHKVTFDPDTEIDNPFYQKPDEPLDPSAPSPAPADDVAPAPSMPPVEEDPEFDDILGEA